jgi:hypothetical protein
MFHLTRNLEQHMGLQTCVEVDVQVCALWCLPGELEDHRPINQGFVRQEMVASDSRMGLPGDALPSRLLRVDILFVMGLKALENAIYVLFLVRRAAGVIPLEAKSSLTPFQVLAPHLVIMTSSRIVRALQSSIDDVIKVGHCVPVKRLVPLPRDFVAEI